MYIYLLLTYASKFQYSGYVIQIAKHINEKHYEIRYCQ